MLVHLRINCYRELRGDFLKKYKINKKRLFYMSFALLFSIVLSISLGGECFASTPKLVSKLEDAFEDIEGWILKLATPAAAVAVGTGVFMKKFSFGDEEKIRTGKKIIRGSLFSYAFILAIDLILSAIESLI